MANSDTAFGFKPTAHFSGGEIRPRAYTMDDASTIYKGDVVKFGANGRVIIAAAGDANKVIGVAAETIATGDDDKILVWDDPNIIFEVQGYTGVTFAEGMVGEPADHVANSADTTYNVSRQELQTPDADEASAQFLILGKVERPGNEWGEHVKLLVKFIEHAAYVGYAASS